MQGFEYPTKPHLRRHGPAGYKDYESYRDWLRDEFLFRCVYCLDREQWDGRRASFHVDHLIPVSNYPNGTLNYGNLLYACNSCNSAKNNVLNVPDPCQVAFGNCVVIRNDGQIDALNKIGKSFVEKLRLNSACNVGYRFRWMRALKALLSSSPSLYQEYMAFPDKLPDLQKKRVPNNTRPKGVVTCYFALRKLGTLPVTY